jgi:hypothetical protein
MPITFACACGKSYTVADALAGKRTQCPVCQAPLTVPAPEPQALALVEEPSEDFEVVEDDAPVEEVEVVEEVAEFEVTAADVIPDVEPVEEPAAAAEEAAEPDGRPAYFLTAFEGAVSTAKLFRVYPDGESLLFIHAGPFHRSMALGDRGRERAVKSVMRAGSQHGPGGSEIAGVAAGIFLAVDWVTAKKLAHDVAKRAEVLDAMTVEQLRAEADANKPSFRVTAGNVSDVVIEEPPNTFWSGDQSKLGIVGFLRFTHRPTGKWKLQLLTRKDTRAAVRAFRKLLGKDNVEVSF